MGYQRRLKQIKRRNARAEANYFAQRYGEVPIAEELINTVEVQEENQDNWSSRVLLLPPHFSGKNYEFWAIKMRSFLRAEDLWCLVQNECVHPLDLEAFEALTEDQKLQQHELALHLIQRAVDESIFHKIAAAKTSKEAWRILEEEFSERGSNMCKQPTVPQSVEEVAIENPAVEAEDSQAVSESHGVEALVDEYEDGTAIAAVETPAIEAVEKFGEPHTVVDNDADEPARLAEALSPNIAEVEAECLHEMVKDSVSQAEPAEFENSEPHCAEPQVDEDNKDDVEEEAAIEAAENGESATQEVAGQPVKAECEDEDELMKSMPMRAEIFPNSLDVCECAGIESKNQLAIAEEKEHAVIVLRNYDEDLKFIEEWLEKPNYVELNCTDVVAVRRLAESSMKAAKMSKEGSHVAAKDEEKGDSFATAVEPAENEEMDEQDEGCEDEKPVEEIFEKWSPEEIRYYYELMWQQATDSQVAENMKSEDSMWEHHMMKATLNFIEGEETWQNAIGKFDDIDGRMRPKELEEIRKKKVRKKKKTRRIVEYKVWSKWKKKAGEGKTNF